VKLLQYDRKTPVEGAYLCLGFGETKDTFVPEQSSHVRLDCGTVDSWAMTPGVREDGDIAVTDAALSGPDLWIEKRLRNAIFMSDRLAEALRRAELSRRFGLRRCQVVKRN
jgi:hypothetical protein